MIRFTYEEATYPFVAYPRKTLAKGIPQQILAEETAFNEGGTLAFS